jgi:hypothetical protein
LCAYLPKVIEAVDVVGMVVGDEDVVDTPHPGGDQLLAEVGPGIDQQPLFADRRQRGGAQPAVLRLGRIGAAPIVADPRHPGTGAGSKDAELHRAGAALSNRRKKLAVVDAAS